MKELLKDWNTIPNWLSYFRIVIIPVFAVLFYKGYVGWALLTLALSGLSDFFDGKIARERNLITDFGKFLDPIADKMLTTAAFLGFTARAGVSYHTKT